jgi:hypothetical protein
VPFGGSDQEWLNSYFESREALGQQLRTLLPINFNWKAYWMLNPSTWYDLKIIHFHGPKPGRLFENIATCDFKSNTTDYLWPHYGPFVTQGVCCDHALLFGGRWRELLTIFRF